MSEAMSLTVANDLTTAEKLTGSVTAVLHFPALPPPPTGYVISEYSVAYKGVDQETNLFETFREAVRELLFGGIADGEIIACAEKKTEGGVHAKYISFFPDKGWDKEWQ